MTDDSTTKRDRVVYCHNVGGFDSIDIPRGKQAPPYVRAQTGFIDWFGVEMTERPYQGERVIKCESAWLRFPVADPEIRQRAYHDPDVEYRSMLS